MNTPDKYSANAIVNKGLYNADYDETTHADKFGLRNKKPVKPAAKPDTVAAVTPVTPAPMPPAPAATTPAVASEPPARSAPKPTPMPDTPIPPPDKFNDPNAVTKATPPPPDKAQSYGSFTLEDLKQQVPQNKEGEFVLEVPEIYYTAGDLEVQKVITGQGVETTAQVLPEKVNNENGHRIRVFRMLVQCCAADARPYSVPVDFGKKAPEFKDMTWVKVHGKMTFKKEGDQTVPVIEATKIEETTAPADAMIY